MTRKKFKELFHNVLGVDIPEEALQMAEAAEKVRDLIVHGKSASSAEIWKAVQSLVDYSIKLNALVKVNARFEAFGDMRGVVGRRGATPLTQTTTRWVLKGMGFSIA
jgi:hypothetical protein